MGWMTGFEPATAGATVRSSTPELHPPWGPKPLIIQRHFCPASGGATLQATAEGPGPAIVRQRRLQFLLTLGQRRRIIEVFHVLRAVRLDHDQLKADAVSRGTRFAPDESAVSFIKPDHFMGWFNLA